MLRDSTAVRRCLWLVVIAVTRGAETFPNGTGTPCVVLKREISIHEVPSISFRRLSERQVIPCLYVLENGYLVGIQDADGTDRVAFLPNRDEWGYPTANCWMADPAIPSNTLIVRRPVPLRPGWLTLAPGSRWPVVRTNTTACTVLYTASGFSRELPIPWESVEWIPPPEPETDPVRLRIRAVSAEWERSRQEARELQTRLQTAQSNVVSLARLHTELGQLEAEKIRLRGELEKAEAACRELSALEIPDRQPALARLAEEMEKLRRQQADWGAKLHRTQVEVEPLRAIRRFLAEAEGEIEKNKATLQIQTAELEALQNRTLPDAVKKDLEVAKSMLDALARENAAWIHRVEEWAAARTALTSLTDLVERLRQKSQQLQDQVQDLTKELQELKKRMGEPPPPAGPTPSVTSASSQPAL